MGYSGLFRNLGAGAVLCLALGVLSVRHQPGLPALWLSGQPESSRSDGPVSLSGKMPVASLTSRSATGTQHDAKTRVSQTYGKLPLGFEANVGQADPHVKFLSRGNGYALFLTSTEAVLQLPTGDSRSSSERAGGADRQPKSARHYSTLRMKLIGANPKPQIKGLDQLPGKSNYFIGNNPTQWHSDVPNYGKIRYENVYSGVDLVYYGNQRQLEYDFVVAPRAAPDVIRLSFEGADKIEIDSQGGLVLTAGSATVHQRKPRVYQTTDAAQREIPGAYVLNGEHSVTLQLAGYDRTKPLVIDPVLVYSTYLGGTGEEGAEAISVDAFGNAYVTGYTLSSDFPTASALQSTPGGDRDVFVAKLNAAGSAIVYSTFLGGSHYEEAADLAVDSSGNVYVTGVTSSSDFPTANSFQPISDNGAATRNGDAFVTKLNATGSALIYSTYLGGSFQDWGNGIAVDSVGNAYVTGVTYSADFPHPNSLQPNFGGIFVAKLNAGGTALAYSFRWASEFDKGSAIAVDASGSAYVTGYAGCGFQTVNALQPTCGGTGPYGDAFVAKLNPAGSAFVYWTYLGGSNEDEGSSIKVDGDGNVYVAGSTASTDFPTVNALQSSFGGGPPYAPFDVFVAKLNPTGSTLVYSTYLGGSRVERAGRMAVDSSGEVYVTGFTSSYDFPLANALQPTLSCNGSDVDAFVVKLNPTGTALVYSTYLGGTDADVGFPTSAAVAVDRSGAAYVTGLTYSSNFPTTSGALQPISGGAADAFVTKISEDSALTDSITLFVPVIVSSTGLNSSFFTSELTLINRGTKDSTLDFTYASAFGGGSGVASDSLPAGQQRIIPDAIVYLKSIGIPIPDVGNRGGSLTVRFSGLSVRTDAGIIVRTTTAGAQGRAGLSYPGISSRDFLTRPSYLCGLRQDGSYRSNVAIQNAGSAAEGDIVLRLTVLSGDPANPVFQVLPPETVSPGQFRQISGILHSNGLSLTNGYVGIERVSGSAPYYAYAVINDQANSDGLFVPPIPADTVGGQNQLTLPVIVETSLFSSALVLTNTQAGPRTLQLSYVANNLQSTDLTANFSITLKPEEQLIIPNLVQYLRDHGVSEIGPIGPIYAGGLFATVDAADASGIFLAANTSTPGGGGRYGSFCPAVPACPASYATAWIYGLQQNHESRTNLALLNTGQVNGTNDVFTIEIFDGQTGTKAGSIEGITLGAKRWIQFERILAQHAAGVDQGYARVTRMEGSNPFIAYAVINDGEHPGDRTGDGSFVSSLP